MLHESEMGMFAVFGLFATRRVQHVLAEQPLRRTGYAASLKQQVILQNSETGVLLHTDTRRHTPRCLHTSAGAHSLPISKLQGSRYTSVYRLTA